MRGLAGVLVVVAMVVACKSREAAKQTQVVATAGSDSTGSAAGSAAGSSAAGSAASPDADAGVAATAVSDAGAAIHDAAAAPRHKVLYIEGGMVRDPATAAHLHKALEGEGFDVETRSPVRLPSAAKELDPFDLVIVSDVPAHLVGLAQMAALEKYVKGGGSLLFATGADKTAADGYALTRLESILPIRFDSEAEELPSAFVLVVERASVNAEAMKDAGTTMLAAVPLNDYFGVVLFDREATILVRAQRAANRERIGSDLARYAVSTGGVEPIPGIKEAWAVLMSVVAKQRHLIVLSSGKGMDNIDAFLDDLRKTRFTTSVIGLPGATRDQLAKLAEAGAGRLHMLGDITELPRVVVKEVEAARKAPGRGSSGIPVAIHKASDVVDEASIANAPPLVQYLRTRSKPTAEVLLHDPDTQQPLLARWRVGTGTAIAWTSNLADAQWVGWAGYGKLWAKIVRASLRVAKPAAVGEPPPTTESPPATTAEPAKPN